jgi:hypothetical protein
MSSISSQELADSASASNEQECEPSPSARSIPIAGPCCESTGQMSLFTEMSESLPPQRLWATPQARDYFPAHTPEYVAAKKAQGHGMRNLNDEVSMLSAAASPAKTSPSPERARALAASAAAYGRSTPELLARYDRATSSWRTSQLCLDGALQLFSETWPRSGLMRNGTAYQLPPLVRLTEETGSGSWPTPTANLYEVTDVPALLERREECKARQNNGNGFGLTLQQAVAVQMWPTPRAIDGTKGARTATDFVLARAATGLANLSERVQLYPTPTAQDASNNGGPSQYDRRSLPLNAVIGGSLNPTWVEWLMGFPLGWTALEPSATQSYPKLRRSSATQSSKRKDNA